MLILNSLITFHERKGKTHKTACHSKFQSRALTTAAAAAAFAFGTGYSCSSLRSVPSTSASSAPTAHASTIIGGDDDASNPCMP